MRDYKVEVAALQETIWYADAVAISFLATPTLPSAASVLHFYFFAADLHRIIVFSYLVHRQYES